MKLRALSHYDHDTDTRFGDCILLYNATELIVFDCGHVKHAEYIESFLEKEPNIFSVHVVVSHNDSDHVNGVCDLLGWLNKQKKYVVKVYTHQYLKHVDAILDKVDDGRRNRDSLKEALLELFDNIKTIIETAQGYSFICVEALKDTSVGKGTIVGPTVDEFIEVAARAVDNRESDKIGEGLAEETVMNAASVQLKCTLSDGNNVILCGDATPNYLNNLGNYSYIQLPHHGQADDAKAIFEKLGGKAFSKSYLISDNTGSAENSGGSDEIVEYMKKEKYKDPYNTRDKIIDLPENPAAKARPSQERRYLGELDSI